MSTDEERLQALCLHFRLLPLLSTSQPPNVNINPQAQEKSSFNYSSHKNFMFLWKYYTIMTENIITDSGRLILAKTWEFSQNYGKASLHRLQNMTSSLILLYLHTTQALGNKPYALCQIPLHLSFFIFRWYW